MRPAPDDFHCGGTLITSKHVLTAKYCIENPMTRSPLTDLRQFKVSIGSPDVIKGEMYGIADYKSFETWARIDPFIAPRLHFHNMAIAELDRHVENPKLATMFYLTPQQMHGGYAEITGWIPTINNENKPTKILCKAQIPILDAQDSERVQPGYNPNAYTPPNVVLSKIDPHLLLSHSDRGTPLLGNGYVIGVSSHVSPVPDHPSSHNVHQTAHFYQQFIDYFIASQQRGIEAHPLVGVHPNIQEVNEGDYPFIVSLGLNPHIEPKPDHFHCGGTLITSKHVLTAKYCIENPTTRKPFTDLKDFKVSIGSRDVTKEQMYGIKNYKTYEQWAGITPGSHPHDMAIAELDEDVDEKIKPATISYLTPEQMYRKDAEITGWRSSSGEGESKVLHKAKIPILDAEQLKPLEPGYNLYGHEPQNIVCSKIDPPIDLGGTDRGSPLLVDGDVVGVSTHVSPVREHPLTHNVHHIAHFYRQFIESITKNQHQRGRRTSSRIRKSVARSTLHLYK